MFIEPWDICINIKFKKIIQHPINPNWTNVQIKMISIIRYSLHYCEYYSFSIVPIYICVYKWILNMSNNAIEQKCYYRIILIIVYLCTQFTYIMFVLTNMNIEYWMIKMSVIYTDLVIFIPLMLPLWKNIRREGSLIIGMLYTVASWLLIYEYWWANFEIEERKIKIKTI